MTTEPQPIPKPLMCASCTREMRGGYGSPALCFECWRRTMGAKTGTE